MDPNNTNNPYSTSGSSNAPLTGDNPLEPSQTTSPQAQQPSTEPVQSTPAPTQPQPQAPTETSEDVFGVELMKFIDILRKLLGIIGYEEEEADNFVMKFFTAVELEAMQRVYNRLSPEKQKELEGLMGGFDASTALNNLPEDDAIAQAQEKMQKVRDVVVTSLPTKELQLLYIEVLQSLFNEYLATVIPATTPEQQEQIQKLADEFEAATK